MVGAEGKRQRDSEVGRLCLVEGCGRRVKPGRAVCPDHRKTVRGREVEAAVRGAVERLGEAVAEGEVEDAERRRAAAERFRRGVALGGSMGDCLMSRYGRS